MSFRGFRRFHSWVPGAIWTPPKQFYQVDLVTELKRVEKSAIKRYGKTLQLKLGKELEEIAHFSNQTGQTKANSTKSNYKFVLAAIERVLEKSTLPVTQQRQKRLESRRLIAPKPTYNAFLNQIYRTNPDPMAILRTYMALPQPRPKYIDPQILDDLLQILISLRHSKDKSGETFRTIIDDMDSVNIPITSRERAHYIYCLSFCDRKEDLRAISRAISRVSAQLSKWQPDLRVQDLPTLHTLLQVGLRLDMSLLEDFVMTQVPTSTSDTHRLLLKASKMSPSTVVNTSTMNPVLTTNILAAQLRSNNSETAEDFLSHILGQHKNAFSRELTAREAVVAHKIMRTLEYISQTCAVPVHIPILPNRGLFLLFLSHYTRTSNFDKILRMLVQMASHGCYPPTYAIYKILERFRGSDWDSEQLDKLIHYLCDISLYHSILTVPLVKQIERIYSRFDGQVASELGEFLISLVGTERERVPIIGLLLTE